MADEDKLIVGVWKLVSVMYEDQATKAMTPIMGDHPRGYQIATPDGRWLALATPSGRTAPTTDEERAQAFRTMIGYSGRYRVDGSTITTKVDVAWNESWVGGEQITSTVFYMVGSELRADHYCDYLNQPRYVARTSADPSVIDFEFREATNLETHTTHFHSTTWRFIDAEHLTQEWRIEGSPKGNSTVHLDFVRKS